MAIGSSWPTIEPTTTDALDACETPDDIESNPQWRRNEQDDHLIGMNRGANKEPIDA